MVMAAAVSDYRVRSVAAQKMKREAARAVLLELEATEDILREVVEQRVAGTTGGGVCGGDGGCAGEWTREAGAQRRGCGGGE